MLGWKKQAAAGIALAMLLSCSDRDRARTAAAQEQALRSWAEQDKLEGDRRLSLNRKELETAKLELHNEELRNELVRLRGGEVDQSGVQMSLRRVNSLQMALSMDQSRRTMCESLLQTELVVYAQNRKDPTHPRQNISDLRKKTCGGP